MSRPSRRRFARCSSTGTRRLPRLEQIAAREGGLPLEGVEVLAPIEPRQVLQAGANYYKHVLDIIVAERRRQGIDEEAARAEGTRIMDERVATGEPYVFLGAVGAICGPYDNVILPPRGEQHDWELELCAVLGPRRRDRRLHDRKRSHDT